MEVPTFPSDEAYPSLSNIPGGGGIVLDHSDPLRSHPVPRVFKTETPSPDEHSEATAPDMDPDPDMDSGPEMESELEMETAPAAAEEQMPAIASTMANAPVATAPKMATTLIDARPSTSETSEPIQLEDSYGVLSAINVFDIIVPMSPWDLSLERVWPPASYQLYCVNHFLHECIIYYSLTSTELKRRDEAFRQLMAEINPGGTLMVEALKKLKRLDLPWPVFCALLRDQIVEAVTRRNAPWKKRQAAESVLRDPSASAGAHEQATEFFRLSNSPIDWPCPPECRYCQQRQVDLVNLSAGDESQQQRRAPMAPMHHIDDSNIDEDQLAEFGGIKFAVDIYDDELKIIIAPNDKPRNFPKLDERQSIKDNAPTSVVQLPSGGQQRQLFIGSTSWVAKEPGSEAGPSGSGGSRVRAAAVARKWDLGWFQTSKRQMDITHAQVWSIVSGERFAEPKDGGFYCVAPRTIEKKGPRRHRSSPSRCSCCVLLRHGAQVILGKGLRGVKDGQAKWQARQAPEVVPAFA